MWETSRRRRRRRYLGGSNYVRTSRSRLTSSSRSKRFKNIFKNWKVYFLHFFRSAPPSSLHSIGLISVKKTRISRIEKFFWMKTLFFVVRGEMWESAFDSFISLDCQISIYTRRKRIRRIQLQRIDSSGPPRRSSVEWSLTFCFSDEIEIRFFSAGVCFCKRRGHFPRAKTVKLVLILPSKANTKSKTNGMIKLRSVIVKNFRDCEQKLRRIGD